MSDVAIQTMAELKEEVFISSGIPELDELVGGFARGRVTEMWGNPGIGKSHVIAKALAGLSSKQTALYIDAEYSAVKKRMLELGVNLKRVDLVQDARLEMVADLVVDKVGSYDLIVIDSLAALVPMTVLDAETGSNAIGLFARQVKHFIAKLKPKLAVSNTALVVINQARAGIGVMAPQEPQGGYAWKHGIDIRLKLSLPKASKLERTRNKVREVYGHKVQVTIQKSRLTPPALTTTFNLIYKSE